MHVRRLEREFGASARIRRRTSLLRAQPNPEARFGEFHRKVYQKVMDFEPEARIHLPEIGQRYPLWSAPALEAWMWVASYHPEWEAEYDWLLYDEFFTRQADISNADVLGRIAGGLGLPEADLGRSLVAEEFRPQVLAEEREWRELGFKKIPSVEVDERPILEGILAYEDYRRAVLEPESIASLGTPGDRTDG